MKRFTLLLVLFNLLLSCDSGPEEILVLNEGELVNELHKEKVGQIVFMGDYIPFESFSNEDVLNSFNLNSGTDFNARMFLGKTLSYYLHQLAPEKSINEICKNGNFQFKFFIDGQLQYEHNLPKGAGSPSNKNEQIIYGIPFINQDGIDHWGRFLWTKFMKLGKAEAILNNGSHHLKIEVRPYLELEELVVGELIAEGSIQLVAQLKEVSEEEKQIQAIAGDSGWELSEDEYDQKKIIDLNTKIAQSYFKKVSSIIVIREGKLALEQYFNDNDRNSLHDTRSVGKSFASALTGIGVDQGWIKGVELSLAEIYDLKKYQNYSEKKANTTIKDLLMMSSFLDASDRDMDSPGQEEKMYVQDDWEKFVLDLPVKSVDEKTFDYNSASAALVGAILDHLSPNGLEKLAEKELFKPLGIDTYQWQYTPSKIVNTAGSLGLRSLDLAKFGQLYKQNGNWEGVQILSEVWANESLQNQVLTANGAYGYFFWNKTYEIDGKTYPVAFASGNGGNQILIFKDIPIVIVITATAYGEAWAHFQTDEMVREYLLPAFVDSEQ